MADKRENNRNEKKRILRWGMAAAVIIALFLFLRSQRQQISDLFDYLFKPRMEVGHIQLSDLSKTEKMKVLSMYKEVVVSQYRQGLSLFYGQSTDEIHTIYPGRIDIGFDLTKCDEHWISTEGDTVVVNLPPVDILNKDSWYIDEAKRQTPIEEGNWTSADYTKMARRANALIKRTCELEDCYKRAEAQGFKVVANLLRAFGFQNMRINIQTREQYKPYYIEDKNTAKYQNPHKFYTGLDGSTFIRFNNNAQLKYQGDFNDEELLAFIDLFNQYTIDQPLRRWNINKQGSKLTIGITTANLTQANTILPGTEQSTLMRIKSGASMICPKTSITISLLDRGGKTIRDYNY